MRFCFLVVDVRAQQAGFGSVHLAWAAHRRGHEVRFVSADELSFLDDNNVLATTVRVRAGDYARPADYLRALTSEQAVREEEALSGFDVVFLRYNPLVESGGGSGSPVLDLCWRLRLAGTLVINDPESLRRASGGMYLADLPAEIRARTLISRSADHLKEFLRALDGPAVLKPLAPGGDEKVFYLRRRQVANLNQIITALTKGGYAVAQEYLPEAEQGEKRLLVLAGVPLQVGERVAIYRRVPVPLEEKLNGHAPPPPSAEIQEGAGRARAAKSPSKRAKPGRARRTAKEAPSSSALAARGSGEGSVPREALEGGETPKTYRRKCTFGSVEARIVELLRPKLLADGVYLASVDIVGDKILAINVFTPGGFHSVRELYGIDPAEHVIVDVERRVSLRLAYRTTYDPEAADVV